MNRPKTAVFVKFYRKQVVNGKLLNSTQLEHSTSTYPKLHGNWPKTSGESRVYRHPQYERDPASIEITFAMTRSLRVQACAQ